MVIRVIEITSLLLIFSVDLLLEDLDVGDHADRRALEMLLKLLHPPLTLGRGRNHDRILFFAKEKVVVGDDELDSVASLGSELDELISVGAS